MKRSQLLQLALLTVAMIIFYSFIESLLGIVLGLMYEATDRYSNVLNYVLRYLVIAALYVIAIVVLVRYNREIADYIDRQGKPAAVNEEKVQLRVDQSSLLFMVLVAVSVISLIKLVPSVILFVIAYFRKEAGFRFGDKEDMDFKNLAIKFVFAIIVLLLARPISDWFARQYGSEKPLLETDDNVSEQQDLNR